MPRISPPLKDHRPRAADRPPWTFLTNHAHVLLSIVRAPSILMRDLATRVGITERAVQRIVADLVDAGFLETERAGRRNRYHVRTDRPLRHVIEQHRSVGSLFDLIHELEPLAILPHRAEGQAQAPASPRSPPPRPHPRSGKSLKPKRRADNATRQGFRAHAFE